MNIFRELWRNKTLVWKLGKNDFKTKYAGSYFGILWAFVQPMVTILIYIFIFQFGFRVMDTPNGYPYALWLIAGIIPWFFFSEGIINATNCLMEYSYLVKKVVFKISVLPLVKILSALFVHLFFIAFTIILYACYGYYPDLYTLQMLYYTFAMMILLLGLIYATSAIVVFFKDLGQIINIILQIGVWMTPIMWNIDGMELNPILITILKLNPMYYIVAGYRDSLINKAGFWEQPGMTIYYWILTIVLFIIGTKIFKKLKPHFADVL